MSGEFTPATEMVRDAFALTLGSAFDPVAAEREAKKIAMFDRWLASVVEAARAEGAAAEREACARRFDAIAAEYREKALRYIPGEVHSWHIRQAVEAEEHAAAIRARSGDGDPHATHDAEVAPEHRIEQVAPWPPTPESRYMLTRFRCTAGDWDSGSIRDVRGNAQLDIARTDGERHAAEFRAGERST